MKSWVSKILEKCGMVLAAGIIFAALLVSITRLLTPVLMEHRADFEKLVSDQIGRPVMIREISIHWHGYEPRIALEDVTLLDLEKETPSLKIERLEVDFNIWRSIWHRQILTESITVSGVELTIDHQDKGQFQIGNLGAVNMQDTTTGQSVHADLILNWIFSQPRLVLKDIDVRYIPLNYPPRHLTLKALALRNSPTHHVLDGSATLNQEMPVNIEIHLGWDGDVRKLPEANGHVYLYFEGMSLPQWLGKYTWQGLQIKQGLASTKLWVRWNKNQVYKVQNTFEIYNLELYSTVTKNSQLVNRISGNLGWKTVGKMQTFAGDALYIDLPDHLWPATNFTVQATADADNNLVLNKVEINYADIADVKHFLLMTSFLSDAERKLILGLSAEGQVLDLKARLPADWSDYAHLSVSGRLQNFNLDAWQKIPTIKNFTGGGSWDGNAGGIQLASSQTTIVLDNYFTNPLYLERLNGNIGIKRDDVGTLTLNTYDLYADTGNLALHVKGAVTLPQNDTPTLAINATYACKDASTFHQYLPLKIMDPSLATWLKNAFVKGQMTDGTAIIQGNMKNFPFTPDTGKFLATAKYNDLELNYGPGWPHVSQIKGEITFAGSDMKVVVHSGVMLNIPVSDVQGEIPYIGDLAPQIINVEATIHSDLAKGVEFIQKSPLQKTLGKNFNGVNLTGPMQLKISLSLPAKNPDQAKILGVIDSTAGALQMPAWKLNLEQLKGAVTFTENSLSATNLQGQIFNKPATINITTLNDKGQSGQTSITLNSNISTYTLEDWLNLSFNNIVQGATDYQVQLLLSPPMAKTSTDQLIITSNLRGVAVDLPAPYGKTSDQQNSFQAAIDLTESKYLKIKLSSAKTLSAAFSLQKDNQQLKLFSGEIKLGSDDAAWQTAPGILVSGQIKELDVTTWQDYFAGLNKNNHSTPQNSLKLLRGINISADVLHVMNLSLHKANVQASVAKSAWDIKMASSEIGATINLPFNINDNAVTGHFDHLTLDSKMAMSKTSKLDPRTLPSMVFTLANVSYDEVRFEHVNVNLQSAANGIVFKELNINQPDLQLNATGEWTQAGTSLQGTVSTPHISDVLKNWGFNSANLLGSTANLNFKLNWPGAPYGPTLSGLSGTLNLKFGEGKIINLSDSTNSKIGLGRLLNIFSLSSLPRHLSFNSKDTAQGFNFDSMNGDFNFRNGSVFTDNMRIEGPVASIAIKGRIGLVAKDLDLRMGVSAHVTGSLPLVAAFAGGPVVGIATLVVDKVVTSQMSKVATYDYTVTNSWANPVWQKATGSN
jgi:uncharacterized protein (TIGR02099 family)